MTRDYAKRTTSKKSSSKKSAYLLLWIFTILLFAIFTIGLVCLGKYQRHLHRLPKIAKILKVETPQPQATNTNAPQFDFYSLLQQKKAYTTISEYELDVTPSSDYATADHLKANLTLLGLTANIAPIQNRYRIIIGPYDNKEGALADQEKLKQSGTRAVLRKIK